MPTRAAPSVLPWWLLWVAFVVYGSLVPWDFNPVPMDQAISQFMRISLLQVGAEGRADWVANGVLYVPVGFLTALASSQAARILVPLVGGIIGGLIYRCLLEDKK
mgnify:CR=1 FL=1